MVQAVIRGALGPLLSLFIIYLLFSSKPETQTMGISVLVHHQEGNAGIASVVVEANEQRRWHPGGKRPAAPLS